jgi:RimJ/RimL family protein N-acetyltransferase
VPIERHSAGPRRRSRPHVSAESPGRRRTGNRRRGAEADARAYLAEHQQARQRGEQVEFALVEPHDGNVVLGGGSLNNVSLEQGRAAIGYWLAPYARGRGVATSQRVAERCGFTREGVLRSHIPEQRENRHCSSRPEPSAAGDS